MDLFDKVKKFEQLINTDKQYDFSKSLKLASKFEKKFNKSAQNSTDPVRKELVKLLVDRWTADPMNFPIEARNLLSSIRYPEHELSFLDLVNTTTQIYQILTKSKDQNTLNFASNNLFPYIDSLKSQINNQSNMPAPPEEPKTKAPAKQIAQNKGYPSIPKEIQTKLNQILVPAGDILPIKEDGILGPETQKALNIYKNKYDFKNQSLAQLIQSVKQHEIST
jgi:hypothetical protein